MIKTITIPYFHIGMKYATPVVLGVGIYLGIIGYIVFTIITIALTVVILTTQYVTEIDLNKKECRDFLSFAWFPFDEEKVKFNSIDRIIIVKENHSQMLNSRSRSRQLDWSSFTATLLFDSNKSIDLITTDDKNKLVTGLKDFADFLKVNIEDRTTTNHFLVYAAR